ncbi:MAG: recombination regulator RecX [Deltaproteobacteria bacterium]|nr:recombination regulator RecX [Deltaproteobacteria bacterium]
MDESKAFASSLASLVRRSHSHDELAKKLARKGFSPTIIATTLERLASLGYLNDEELAVRFAALKAPSWSSRRIVQSLARQKGIAPHTVALALLQARNEVGEEEAIANFIAKKLRGTGGLASLNDNEYRKLFASLLRQGFAVDAIKEALRR